MPQFPHTPERERTLSRTPDYAVKITRVSAPVTVACGGTEIARSTNALLVEEPRHDPAYYLPAADVTMDHFTATDHATFCPFKGHASYWTLALPDQREENVVWSYQDPYSEVEELKDYLSFYTNRTQVAAT